MNSAVIASRSSARPLPEIILAVGALVLVLVGAYPRRALDAARRHRRARAARRRAVAVLLCPPASAPSTFGGAFVVDGFARFMKVLALLGSAADASSCRRDYHAPRGHRPVRVPDPHPALDDRHADDDLGQRPDRALSRPRAAEPRAYVIAAFHRDNVRSTEAGLKYFVLGALSSGMLLYGASLVYGFTGTVSLPGHRGGAAGRRRPIGLDLRHRLRRGRPRLQDLGRAVPHVDAGRLRGRADAGDGLLRLGAQDGRHGDGGARLHRRLPGHPRRSGSRSSSSSPSLRWRSAPSRPSARRNIKRLMAYSSIGNVGYALIGLAAGTAAGRAGRR